MNLEEKNLICAGLKTSSLYNLFLQKKRKKIILLNIGFNNPLQNASLHYSL